MDKGLFIINTGNGKGKTTAALGMVLRSLGYGYKCAVIQFIKDESFESGERDILKKLGCVVETHGKGFTWENTREENAEAFLKGFESAEKKIASGEYDLLVLDEINCCINENCFDAKTKEDIVKLISSRSEGTTLVFTGRGAPDWLLGLADTVTEMKEIKHAFNNGTEPVKGIEY
ncbi:MAG: cob(I)yrinic acid a,c-diamide adenosyltransferase [Firmicutes bacterium]|nr:cob(I)yrinic acid a,c-diamide adenosyltransferase [Bacillota bacterium]